LFGRCWEKGVSAWAKGPGLARHSQAGLRVPDASPVGLERALSLVKSVKKFSKGELHTEGLGARGG